LPARDEVVDRLPARLAAVRAAVAAAARGAGRDPATVGIVAVTKTFPPVVVSAAVAAGLSDVGENYVQEAAAKRSRVSARASWHLIGGVQRNKVRAAVALFDRIHTVDSTVLAAALGAAASGRRLAVLIQVNVRGGLGRRGVPLDGVESVARAVLAEPALVLDGLMTLPPAGTDADENRRHFRVLREVRDVTAMRLGVELPHLSMGMSDDFTVAVEEGATWIRLGRALFGARAPAGWRPGSSAGGGGS